MIRSTIFALSLLALPAAAEGFQNKDLRTVDVDLSGFVGGAYNYGANAPDRLTILCTDCEGIVGVDVFLQRSEDGTEGRYRSGETTVEGMEKLCQDRNPTCTLEGVKSGDAVGRVTQYEAAGQAGSTTVLFLDGDMLVIRSIASTPEVAFGNGATAREVVAPLIIGSE